MPTSNRVTVVPYPLVLQSAAPPISAFEENIESQYDQKRNQACPVSPFCICISSFFVGLALIILLIVFVGIPLIIALSTSVTPKSSSTTNAIATTDTIFTTIDSASTAEITTVSCSPACGTQKTCVQGVCVGIGYLSCTMTWSRPGDGDLVVKVPSGHVISFNNTGPSQYTDQGQLDVDDRTGTGPENIFWSNGRSMPPNGIYHVCFEPYYFDPDITSQNPISVRVNVMRSNDTSLTMTKDFTSTIKNGYDCDVNSKTLLISFTYP